MMQKYLLFSFLLLSISAYPQTASHPAVVDVQVVSSHIESECSQVVRGSSVCRQALYLGVQVGQRLLRLEEVQNKLSGNLLVLGSYKARLVKDDHSKPYLSSRVYELQFPDGTTERFDVVGEFAAQSEKMQGVN
jgi:hypothetical protein